MQVPNINSIFKNLNERIMDNSVRSDLTKLDIDIKSNYFFFPFIIKTGLVNITDKGFQPNNGVPQNFTQMSQIFTGKEGIIAQWKNAIKIRSKHIPDIWNYNFFQKEKDWFTYSIDDFKKGLTDKISYFNNGELNYLWNEKDQIFTNSEINQSFSVDDVWNWINSDEYLNYNVYVINLQKINKALDNFAIKRKFKGDVYKCHIVNINDTVEFSKLGGEEYFGEYTAWYLDRSITIETTYNFQREDFLRFYLVPLQSDKEDVDDNLLMFISNAQPLYNDLNELVYWNITFSYVKDYINTTGQTIQQFVPHQVKFNRKEMNYTEFSAASKSFTETGSNLINIFKMPYTLVGKQYSQYGIGLGEAFILIATFIGIFASTIIYNRRSRTPNTRFYQHYLSKMLILQVNMFIQVSILLLMLLPIGFWQLGSAFWLLYLFSLYVGFIFTFIVGGIWLSIPDEVSSRVLNMVVLMFNFACGWILFPAFMSNPFYNALSNIMPFTYAMHNMGNIIYGIALGAGQLWYYQADIIKNCLVLLAMAIIMIVITLATLHVRFLRAHYGTRRMSVIYKAMTQVESTAEYAHKRSVLLILTKEQKKEIKAKVNEILFTNISEKYSYTKLTKRQIKKMERNSID